MQGGLENVSNLKNLLNERAALDKRIEEARRTEASVALKTVRELVVMFRFTRAEVFGGLRMGHGPHVAARFRDAATGATWNGKGPRPAWLRGKDIEQYRIGETD